MFKFFFILGFSFLIIAAITIIPKPTAPDKKILSNNTPKTPFKIKASIPYWDQDNAFSSFNENVDAFSYLNLFWYYLNDNGEINKYEFAMEDEKIIAFAHSKNVKVFAVIANLPETKGTTWNSERVEDVLKNKTTRKKHIQDILGKLESLNFDGATIDYEEVKAKNKDNFTLFIKELSESLHKKNKITAVALHPKTKDAANENGEFQDWSAISKYADHLNIMAYGQHWDESEAGPIASYGWIKQIITYTEKLKISKNKIFLGIPLYGYDWNKEDKNKASGLVYDEVATLIKNFNAKEKWHPNFRSPYFFYEKENNIHEVWYENTDSVEEKINLAIQANFAGVSFWRLGGEDPSIWPMAKKLIK